MGKSLQEIARQNRLIAAGRCRCCGRKNPKPVYHRCPDCRRRDRENQRRRRGWEPWRPGGPGRPPKEE